mmetsp:Transcript_68825/g.199314  ORF Transcript_68825/g.199314 Transcript_68825/m.199314 type:complete len:95 (-) Transcript_68825:927-1211(-)
MESLNAEVEHRSAPDTSPMSDVAAPPRRVVKLLAGSWTDGGLLPVCAAPTAPVPLEESVHKGEDALSGPVGTRVNLLEEAPDDVGDMAALHRRP